MYSVPTTLGPVGTMFGPIDTFLGAGDPPVVLYLILVLVLVNMGLRVLGYREHRRQAADGAEALSRYLPLTAVNVLLVLTTFYFLTLEHHAGIVLSTLVIGMFLSDFFEFEARLVEAREERPLDAPKSAIAASVLVLLYVSYLSLFFLVEPLWNAVV